MKARPGAGYAWNKGFGLMRKAFTYAFALVWLINGLYCKVLHQVTRHEQIVGALLGKAHAGLLTRLIGFAEIMMACWIVSRYRHRLNAIVQILIIAFMNLLEVLLVPDLLLWGRLNGLFAGILIAVIYRNEFHQPVKAISST